MHIDEFYEVFIPVVEYYKANLSKAVIALYYENLKHLSKEELNYGLTELIKTRKYSNMPQIAEILEAINGDIEAKAQLALDELIYALNRYGTYRSVSFSDRAIMSVVMAVGGWEVVGTLDGQDWKDFKKWEFKKLYKVYAKQNNTAPDYLIGKTERENRFNNLSLKAEKIYFIGSDTPPIGVLEFKPEAKKPNLANSLMAKINKAEPKNIRAVI